MKRLVLGILLASTSCGPESPTPSSPSTPASAAPVSTPPSASPKPDRSAKARATFLAMRATSNAHDASRTREIYAADATKGTVGPDGFHEIKGVDVIEKQIAQMVATAPDLQWKSLRVFQRDDFIADEYVVVGTNGATGKRAGVRGIALYWFDDEGKVKKERVYIDQLTMLVQTGRAQGSAPEPSALPSGDPPWLTARNDAIEEANVATFKTTWPAKALLARGFEHADVASGAAQRSVPTGDFVTDEAWGFGRFVVAEMQMKEADGILKHVVEVAENDERGQLLRSSQYGNRLEGKGLPALE